jgi:hypothetical protein
MLFSKSLLSRLCCSLSKLVIGKLGANNMGEVNCEKGENYYFFHTTTPCATSNILLLLDQLMLLHLIKTQFVTNFLMVEFG